MKKLVYIFLLIMSVAGVCAGLSGCGAKGERDTADNAFTVEYINSISITEPEKALAILDTAEERGVMSEFDINRLRCLAYHNGLSDYKRALQHGLKAYHMPEARENARQFLNLVELIADEYFQNGDYAESIKLATDGLKVAKDSLLKGAEANLNVALGINLFELDRPDEGFCYLNKAVEILNKESINSDSYMATDDYIYALGMVINSLCDEKRYEEALKFVSAYEEAIERLESKKQLPEGIVDMRKANGYAAFSYMYALTGEMGKASDMYRKLLATDYSENPEERGALLVPYLLASKQYKEALPYLREEKKYLRETTDTVTYEYIDYHLSREQEAYEGIGDLRAANAVSRNIQHLNDTLRRRNRNEKALELAEIYKTNEQKLEIERQSASILIRNIIITSAVLFLALSILFIIRMLRYNSSITAKNRAMVNTIDELMVYKNRMFEQQEELVGLRAQVQELSTANKEASIPMITDEPETRLDNPGPAASKTSLNDADRMLFERMNHEILCRKLFLNPEFSKNFLLDEYHIPAYKFSAFFKEFAGCTFSQYIHNCRLDHAVKLIMENPAWSLDAVARSAQMSMSSFYSQFKRKFGMSPSDFRAAEKENKLEHDRLSSK